MIFGCPCYFTYSHIQILRIRQGNNENVNRNIILSSLNTYGRISLLISGRLRIYSLYNLRYSINLNLNLDLDSFTAFVALVDQKTIFNELYPISSFIQSINKMLINIFFSHLSSVISNCNLQFHFAFQTPNPNPIKIQIQFPVQPSNFQKIEKQKSNKG